MTASLSSSRTASQAVTEVMEQVFHLSYSVSYIHGMRPTQWAALRYFEQSEDNARTVINYAKYSHLTKGTASQTIRALVQRGLLVRAPVFSDRRSHRIDLTEKGRRLLEDDPIAIVVAAIEKLPPGQRDQLASSLRTIFGHLLEVASQSKPESAA